MSLTKRVLRFSFSGGLSGGFTAAGLRAAASIQITDGILGTQAAAKIWGLSEAQMNSYSSAIPNAINDELPDANLVIEAGDLGGSFIKVIDGPIFSSNIDLTDSPDSAFLISVAGIADAATPIGPQSQPPDEPGEASRQDVEDLIASLCVQAGWTLHNNGVSGVLTNMNTYGSAFKQIDDIANAGDFHWILNGTTLSIWPKGGTIDDTVVTVGPKTTPRMVGYPSYWPLGITVTSLFNPEIQVGRLMNVVGSSIKKANGLWSIVNVQHELTSVMPKGPWFTIATLAGIDT